MPKVIKMCHDMLPTMEQLPRFARLAVQENANNVGPGMDSTPAQGKILPMQIAFVTAKKWKPGRVLNVAFLDGDGPRQNLVERVAAEWSKHCSIKFQFGVPASQAEIRVSFRQNGAWSYIGTDCLGIPKNQPTMNYGFIDEGTVLHEFGHALGCIHEHQHPEAGIPWDREKVYRYYSGPPNNWSRQTVDVNLFQKYDRTDTQFSVYDPDSIMHYPVDEALTTGNFSVGWNRKLSATDIKYVSGIYPKDDAPVTPPPPTAGTVAIPASGKYRLVESGGKKAVIFE